MEEGNIYNTLPLHSLVEVYYQFYKNIKRGILSYAMYQEIDLIKQAANQKGISFDYVYKKGSLMVKIEQQIK